MNATMNCEASVVCSNAINHFSGDSMSLQLSQIICLIRQELGEHPELFNKLRALDKQLAIPKRGLERKEKYTPEAVFLHVPESSQKNTVAVFDGDEIKMNSLRYHVFKRSLCCATCGIIGSFFAKEMVIERANKKPKDKTTGEEFDRWHFNLYAVDGEGKEILMTKDHIIPLSKGGSSSLNNLQTMCAPCNRKKGNTLE
jgi:hypothetical protein